MQSTKELSAELGLPATQLFGCPNKLRVWRNGTLDPVRKRIKQFLQERAHLIEEDTGGFYRDPFK